MSENKKKIGITICNHFDLGWRRSQDRPVDDKGRRFIPYSDIQRYNIEENLRLCRKYPNYKFNIESVSVVWYYLEHNPERAEELVRLVKEGRCYIPLSGINIMDTNMVHGESIVRNFVYGMRYLEDTFGYRPKRAVRNDAFGNSAQLPQILKGCGINWVTGLSYSPSRGEWWRGLDGSTIFCGTLPGVGHAGGWLKYPPCPACRGYGELEGKVCPECHGMAIDRSPEGKCGISFDPAAFGDGEVGLLISDSEEQLPNEGLLAFAEEMSDSYEVSFTTLGEHYEYLRDKIELVDIPEECIHPSPELNPNNTGCYVSRIETKLRVRRMEYALGRLEALSVMLRGKAFPIAEAELLSLWNKLLYSACHDQITAEHIDAVYEDLTRAYDAFMAEYEEKLALLCGRKDPGCGVYTVVNPSEDTLTEIVQLTLPTDDNYEIRLDCGELVPILEQKGRVASLLIRDIKPFTALRLTASPSRESRRADSDAPRHDAGGGNYSSILQASEAACGKNERLSEAKYKIENEYFTIEADDAGLIRIIDRSTGGVISDIDGNGDRPGELIYEHDEGSPWATLSPERTRAPMNCEFIGVERTDGYERISYRYSVGVTVTGAIEPSVMLASTTLVYGMRRVDFHTEVDWDDYNRRIRAIFPLPKREKGRAVYEIPYGIIERKPYEPIYHWAGSNGDWPAINVAGVEDELGTTALMNRGTPSYYIDGEARRIELSLLRSPTLPTYLHEPRSYSMTAWDGMRDVGCFSFDYALCRFAGERMGKRAVGMADAYNRGLALLRGDIVAADMPSLAADHSRISWVKPASDDRGIILRITELEGRAESASLALPRDAKGIARVNLMEENECALDMIDRCAKLELAPHEIATVKVIL